MERHEEAAPRPVGEPAATAATEGSLRDRAVRRLRKQAEFRTHLPVYLVVNAMLIAIWAWTGNGFFWPVFPLVFWGIGVVAHGVEAFGPDTVTEDRIQREMDRMRRW